MTETGKTKIATAEETLTKEVEDLNQVIKGFAYIVCGVLDVNILPTYTLSPHYLTIRFKTNFLEHESLRNIMNSLPDCYTWEHPPTIRVNVISNTDSDHPEYPFMVEIEILFCDEDRTYISRVVNY